MFNIYQMFKCGKFAHDKLGAILCESVTASPELSVQVELLQVGQLVDLENFLLVRKK